MPAAGRRAVVVATLLALTASFVWATYYFFVLGSPSGVAPSAFLVYPFLFGGLAFAGASVQRGRGAAFLRLWSEPIAWVRVLLIVGMQVSVLAATYAAGAVDTSLLSLVGDVVLTPILLLAVYREGVGRVRSPAFVPGLALASIGATLTIVGGGSVRPLEGWAWLVAPAVPLSVALYFLLTARAAQRVPTDAVIAQATLGGALVTLLLSPLIPGGALGLLSVPPSGVVVLVVLGVTSFFLAPVLYFDAIERVGLMLPALLMATIPVFTLALAVLVLAQVPPWLALLGIPIAVVGAALAGQGEHLPWAREYAPGRADPK